MKIMGVWIHVLGSMGLVKFRMEKCRFCIIVWICVVLV